MGMKRSWLKERMLMEMEGLGKRWEGIKKEEE